MAIAELACPNCGGDLRFIEQYGRHFCHDCGQYAPEGFGGGKGLTCPTCGGVLSYIPEYDRYYCHRDAKYVDDESAAEPPQASPSAVAPEVDEFDSFLSSLERPPKPAEPAKEPPHSETETASQERAPPGPTPDVAPHEPTSESGGPAPAAPEPQPEEIPHTAPTPSTHPSPTPARPTLLPLLLPRLRRASGKDTVPPPPTPGPPTEPPPLSRASLWKAKKSVLEQLCTDYGLNAKGSRETLRDRLMKKLAEVEHERVSEDARSPPVGPPTLPTPAEAEVERSTEQTPGPLTAPTDTAREEPGAVDAPSAEPQATAANTETPVSTGEATVLVPRTAEDAKFPTTPVEPSSETTLATVEPQEVASETTRAEPAASTMTDVAPVPVEPAPAVVEPVAVVERPRPAGTVQPKAHSAATASPPVGPAVVIPHEPRRIEPGPPQAPPRPEAHAIAPERAKSAPATARTAAAHPTTVPAAAAGPACPTCGRALSFIADFGRHYCYSCKRYAPIVGGATRTVPEVRVEVARATPNLCPTCRGELRYIAQYDRHYCDTCGKYTARRARRPCPTCGADLTWVARYRRFYCTACLRYAPATFPTLAAATGTARVAGVAGANPAPAAVAGTGATARSESTHHHVSATIPLGIAMVGFVLYALSASLLLFSAQLGIPSFVTPTPSVAYMIGFFGVLLSMAGTIWGLWALNSRK